MLEINIKDLRDHLAHFITQVEAGEQITITRRGKVVAQLVPPPVETPKQLPDLTQFRASIKLQGEAMSETVIRERQEVRY